MSLTINTNLASILVQHSLNNSTFSLNQAIERMTTGFKINSAKDDAAGFAIAENMDVKLSSYDIAKSNTEMGLSLINTASSSMDILTTHLQRIRDLSEQAANGTYDIDSRMAIQSEIDQRLEEIDRIIATTEYNGIKLFEGGAVSPIATYAASPSGVTGDFIKEVTQLSEDEAIAQGYTVIKTAAELQNMSSGGKYILMNDINLSGVSWTSISNFSGELNGNGYVVKNLTINSTGNAGLFANARNMTTIKNLGVENANVIGSSAAGILIGHSFSATLTIDNCYTTGEVSAPNTVGGMIGYQDSSGCYNISNSWANVDVSSGGVAGGLVGSAAYNPSSIDNSYTTGFVSGSDNVGGLVGSSHGNTISNSYSTSTISGSNNIGGIIGNLNGNSTSSIANTYYNTDIINQGYGSITNVTGTPIGVTTAELQALIDNGTLPKIYTPPAPVGGTGSITLQVGIDSSEDSQITFDTAFSLGTLSVNAMSTATAHAALADIDAVLDRITAKQTEFGAIMNRLESVNQSLNVSIDNVTSSLSTIKDADIAVESSRFIKSQILQQASATLLATANQSPSIALQLI